ncbi:MAG: dihydrodipicolinate reductase C-terminal domain-containing protein [Bdellovibrionota bacterium]|nr:dihydrodipicolinate reductase C-terminal domain-containing protein [Bdellovibrionota bacterium]
MGFEYALMGANGRMGQAIIKNQEAFRALCVCELGRNISDAHELSDSCKTLIDFSLPEVTPQVIEFCKEHKLKLVSGVTGYSEEQLEVLKDYSSENAVFWSPNMSLGVAIFKHMLKSLKAAKEWDYHLHEAHHIHKIDRPSGTAKYLQRATEDVVGKEVPVTDMRGGGVFGVHELYAMSPEEEIQITHRAYNREVFAKGALEAAAWIQAKEKGFFCMDDMF